MHEMNHDDGRKQEYETRGTKYGYTRETLF
jgi:hypothetical protein